MRTYLDCIPCFFKQALEASRLSGLKELQQREVLNKIAEFIPSLPLEITPPEIAEKVYGIVKDICGVEDPLREFRKRANEIALNLYPWLKREIRNSSHSLLDALKISAGGNMIDFATLQRISSKEVKENLGRLLNHQPPLFQFGRFYSHLLSAKKILLIGDNAGEIVFDKLLIENFPPGKEIFFAVRGGPAINDALMEDALQVGLDRLCQIISTGTSLPGILLGRSSPEFQKIFKSSDLILAKGQGNYETLNEVKAPIFFLLQVKCQVLATHLKVNIGEIVLFSHYLS